MQSRAPWGTTAAAWGSALGGMRCARERFRPCRHLVWVRVGARNNHTYPDLAGVVVGSPRLGTGMYGCFRGRPGPRGGDAPRAVPRRPPLATAPGAQSPGRLERLRGIAASRAQWRGSGRQRGHAAAVAQCHFIVLPRAPPRARGHGMSAPPRAPISGFRCRGVWLTSAFQFRCPHSSAFGTFARVRADAV